jgi:hypothetical protein
MSRQHRPKVLAVVTLNGREGESDTERRVATLEELYAICRDAPPSRLIRVMLEGDDGEVRLHFASFHRRPGT